MRVTAWIPEIECRLINDECSVPVHVRFVGTHLVIQFDVGMRLLEIELDLVGSAIRLVERNYTPAEIEAGAQAIVKTLFDFRSE